MVALDPWADDPDDGGVHPVIAAEQCVLGAMMSSASAIEAAVEIIAPRDFLRPAHQVIANRIVTMYAAGEPVDPVTLAAELRRDGDLGKAGDAPYLHTLFATVTTSGSVAHHARLVADAALRRRVIEAGVPMASARA